MSTPAAADTAQSSTTTYPVWHDREGWAKITQQEDASLTSKCSRCGVCGGNVVSQYASYALQCAYESNNRIPKCSCCSLCQSRAVTTEGNYDGTQCVSAANQTICFWTKEQRDQHFASVKSRFVAYDMKGRPCRACCAHFGFSQPKK